MDVPPSRIIIHRRHVLTLAAATIATGILSRGLLAGETGGRSAAFEAALREILAGRSLEEGEMKLVLPEHAENGNIVPYEIAVESPMLAESFVSRIHLLSTGNPHAKVASFRFTPQSGRASVKGRMRLARTQDVVAVAETSAGKVVMLAAAVEVAIGGCET